jgi:choline/glycine/proline betaine transport protein
MVQREVDTRVKPVVFYGAAGCVLAIVLWAMISPDSADSAIGTVVRWVSEGLGWYYFLAATIFLGFVVFIAVSRYGKTKLGPEHSTPDYSLFAWGSMLFAAGIGIDLMFFSVAGPVAHYLEPPVGDGETVQAAREAVRWTLFHYGITGWAMYALMGMALAYFVYRHNLPLAVRSALYPIIGKRIYGHIGDAVDIAAVLGTIFGIAMSLGIGVVQLNYGLSFLFDLPEGRAVQIALIAVAFAIAVLSAVAGIDKGLRRLSELNVVLAIVLMLFILFTGDTIFLLNGIVLNIGDYLSGFASITLDTFAYDRPTEWLNAWTLFFWAFWVAWAPFIGVFLARISRGRTIRQFVTATLIVPFTFILIWISIFGNSAIDVVRSGNAAFGQAALELPEQAFYALIEEHPWVTAAALVATFTGMLFYVTSADSGALVMGNLTSHLHSAGQDSATWVRVFWAAATALLTLAMLLVGGIQTLQNATIIMGLPFSFVMFFVIIGLYKALRVERFREDSFRTSLASSLSERTAAEGRGGPRTWKQRLTRAVSYPGYEAAARFVQNVCRPAFEEVAAELRAQGCEATVTVDGDEDGLVHVDLLVDMGDEEDFAYGIRPLEAVTPAFAPRAQRVTDTYFRLEVHLSLGSQGYDLMDYSKDQVIGDILDQYERHLEFLRLNRGASTAGAVLGESPDTYEMPEEF